MMDHSFAMIRNLELVVTSLKTSGMALRFIIMISVRISYSSDNKRRQQ